MAETMTLQQRMAMLNLDQVGTNGQRPIPPAKKAAPPPLPRLPPRSNSTDNEKLAQSEVEEGHRSRIGNLPCGGSQEAPVVEKKPLVPPALPRRTSVQPAPTPNRRPSEMSLARRDSLDSIASTVSTSTTTSSLSQQTSRTSASRSPSFDSRNTARSVKAPAFDPSSLPKLPPKRSDQQHQQQQPPQPPKRPSFQSSSSSASLPATAQRRDSLALEQPPLLPRRTAHVPNAQNEERPRASTVQEEQPPPQPDRPKRSALSYSMNRSIDETQRPQRPKSSAPTEQTSDAPPPIPSSSKPTIPTSSKPSISQVCSASPKAAAAKSATSCLKCRDFSAPDKHAARFPRESIPSTDINWLASQLTSPFTSVADKARTIFVWLHHNILYNTKDFFAGDIKPSTPSSTIESGLAVCEGYAGLFAALAVASGLEAVVVGGHGKGFGHQALAPGAPAPSFNANHAWNACRLDDGEWKLLDACWGAGHTDHTHTWIVEFNPSQFTMDNDDFGLTHFPEDERHFYRSNGGRVSWEQYSAGLDGPGENVQTFTGLLSIHGLSATSFLPSKKNIKVSGRNPDERIQFQMSKYCEHWDGVKAGVGKPYVYVLSVGGRDGRKREMLVFQTDGRHWWVDVRAGDLGCAGQSVTVNAITTLGGREGRGLSVQEVKEGLRRGGWGSIGVAAWQLV